MIDELIKQHGGIRIYRDLILLEHTKTFTKEYRKIRERLRLNQKNHAKTVELKREKPESD